MSTSLTKDPILFNAVLSLSAFVLAFLPLIFETGIITRFLTLSLTRNLNDI